MNIENKKQIGTILLAIGLGFVGVFLMSLYVQDKIQEQTKAIASDYEKKRQAEQDMIRQQIEATYKEIRRQVQEQQRTAPMVSSGAPGQPVATQATSQTFSLKTPKDKRAVTILIDSLSAVGGLISPGDFVDIAAQMKVPDPREPNSTPQDVTSVLFQNIQVLAVGTNFNPVTDTGSYSAQQNSRSLTVTLALSPEEASLLTFVQNNGKLQMALRSPESKDAKQVQVASWDALSDFVLEKQGTELVVPRTKTKLDAVGGSKVSGNGKSENEVKPFIQIFRGGREL